MMLASNLQRFRKQKGLSQEELSEVFEVSRQSIAKWENGESFPTIEKLISIADYFKLTLDELVGRKNDIELFDEFFKRYKPVYDNIDDKDDPRWTINRTLEWFDLKGFSPEEKLDGLKTVFFSDLETE